MPLALPSPHLSCSAQTLRRVSSLDKELRSRNNLFKHNLFLEGERQSGAVGSNDIYIPPQTPPLAKEGLECFARFLCCKKL